MLQHNDNSYVYDDEGSLTRKENSTTRYEYEWDWRNRLTTVRLLGA